MDIAPTQQDFAGVNADDFPFGEKGLDRFQGGFVVPVVKLGNNDAAVGDVIVDIGSGQPLVGWAGLMNRPRAGDRPLLPA
jgi:hypothetical protein